jgi:predicted RNA-binding protein with PUA-like domain
VLVAHRALLAGSLPDTAHDRSDRAAWIACPVVATWLLKSEPDVFGYDDLVRVGREGWDGVRNYTARNFLRAMRVGDRAIFYHSNAAPPGAAGICKIVKAAEPDPTQFDPRSKYYDPASKPEDPRWDWVTVAPVRPLRFVALDELRAMPELASSPLLAKGNRLSVMPLTDEEFDAIVRAGRRRR